MANRKEAALKFATAPLPAHEKERRRQMRLYSTAFGKGEKSTVIPGLIAAGGIGYGVTDAGTKAMRGYAHARAAQDIYKNINQALPDAMKVVDQANEALAATEGINKPTWRGKKPGGIRKFFRGIFRSPKVVSHVDQASEIATKSKPLKTLKNNLASYHKLVGKHYGKIPTALKGLNSIARVALPIVGVAALAKTVSNASHNAKKRARALEEIASTRLNIPTIPGFKPTPLRGGQYER